MNSQRIGLRVVMGLALGLTALAGSVFTETQVPAQPEEGIVDVGNTTCPITGQAVKPKYTTVYQGKLYHFCCPHCAEKFLKGPEKYLAKMEK